MKRGPQGYERFLVHQTSNTGRWDNIALCRENFTAASLSRLHESLPHVPGMTGWEVDRDELDFFQNPKCDDPTHGPERACEFRVRVSGKVVSRNRVTTDHGTMWLQTALLAAARRLSVEEADFLTELEQNTAVVILEWPEWL